MSVVWVLMIVITYVSIMLVVIHVVVELDTHWGLMNLIVKVITLIILLLMHELTNVFSQI